MEENLFKQSQDSPVSDPLTTEAKAAASKVETLQDELNEAEITAKLLDDLVLLRQRGWHAHIKALCEKESKTLKGLREKDHSGTALIEGLYREAKAKAERAVHNLPADLVKSASLHAAA